MKIFGYIILSAFLFLTCERRITSSEKFNIEEISTIEAYQDIRWKDLSNIENQLDSSMVRTLTYNESTIWPKKYKNYAKEIMDKGKNPGLGIKQLHDQGITGQGISAAIIDQNLCSDYHPEFQNKIIKYKDFDCNQPSDKGSMHGPAVTSLFIGNTIGVAPDVRLFYAAVPSWNQDAKDYADALNWIIEENSELPIEEKIRVVSVSAAPSGENNTSFTNKEFWDEAHDRALANGILVIDCTMHHLSVAFCYYEINSPDDIIKCIPGFPGVVIPDTISRYKDFICTPASFRTEAEQNYEGQYSYQYTGRGGLSWSVPYLAGVLCLGWQINPDLSYYEIIDYIYDTAYLYNENIKIISPAAFIEKIQNII